MSSISTNERNLVVSMIQFIREKSVSGQLSDDQVESLEVVVQCLGAGFGLTDSDYAFQPSRPLIDIFTSAEGQGLSDAYVDPSESEKLDAEGLKNEGNELMRDSKFDEAVQKYNEAIKLYRNSVFFCNRAAAYSKMEQHDLAIQDCRTALSLDPQYSKAYGRMGLALSSQKRYQEAVDSYKKALELDPENDSFKTNLKIAEQKVQEANSQRTTQPQGMPPNPFGPGGPPMDMGAMLNNPAMMNMASQLMSDPGIQNLMTNLVGGAINQPGGPQGLGNLLQAGQQLAEQMQQSDPEMVTRLRERFGGVQPPREDGQGDPKDPPPPPPPNGGNDEK